MTLIFLMKCLILYEAYLTSGRKNRSQAKVEQNKLTGWPGPTLIWERHMHTLFQPKRRKHEPLENTSIEDKLIFN